jgi:hypothetical protein
MVTQHRLAEAGAELFLRRLVERPTVSIAEDAAEVRDCGAVTWVPAAGEERAVTDLR